MGTNGFRDDELVSRKVKVGNEWQTKVSPVVGGRLRLAHEENQNLNLQTEMVSWDGQFAIFKCCAVTVKGQFIGYGTANAQRDVRLADSLIELAETRSIARALRFAGYGLEFTGAEEISHVTSAEPETEQSSSKEPARVFPQSNGTIKTGGKASGDAIDPTATGGNGSKGQGCPIEKPQSNGAVTSAQVRALYALTKRARYEQEDIASMLAPFQVSRFEDLQREAASQLIGYLQTEVAA